MTSLVLFNSERPEAHEVVKPGVDWGTAKTRSRSSDERSSSHPAGTYLYRGEPIQQNYRNTDITLSHVRINDELVPAPLHTTDITPHQIPLKFPSNHPFSSHISEKAVFPNASINVDDRPSTDVDPYIVTHKIRGNPYRREVHYGGTLRQGQRTTRWPDQQYMQLARSVSDLGSAPIYPWPRQMFGPNNEYSTENSATNIAKNKERSRMETTYQGDYVGTDGLGSHVAYDTTVALSPTERLKPFFNKTLDPARPIDGVQADQIHGNHRQPNPSESPRRYVPKPAVKVMSEDEKLDDHLRNGTDYVNLPAQAFPANQAPRWSLKPAATPPASPREIRYLHHLRPSTDVPQIVLDHQRSHQQIEAENRLQELEVIQAKDNINLLNIKFRTLQHARHSRPILPQYHQDYVKTFYDQVGSFVQERSGLYQTANYDPKFLSQSMTELGTHDAYDHEPAFKDERDMNDLMGSGEYVQQKSKPKLFQYKAFGDYQAMRNRLIRPFRVPLDSSTVDVRTQEGTPAMIQRETVYGQSYNTRKFLEENTLAGHARTDPTALMSTGYNRNLERVRSLNSYPNPPAAEPSFVEEPQTSDIVIGPLLPPAPYDELYATQYINEHSDGYSRRSVNRVYDSPFKGEHEAVVYKTYPKESTPVPLYPMKADALPRAAKTFIRLPGPEIVARSLEPTREPHSTYQHSYHDVAFEETITPMSEFKPHLAHNRLSMKDNDPRFGRTSDGRVKQWKLIDLQDHWTKSNAQRQYHLDHPENVPFVGEATIRAKKDIMIADIVEKQQIVTVR